MFLPFLTTRVKFTLLKSLREKYDYVIVGAGAAGLTVANRLSENAGRIEERVTFYELPVSD